MVGVVGVELAEVAPLVPDAHVGEGDADEAWREENHLEAVILQVCWRGVGRGWTVLGKRRRERRESLEGKGGCWRSEKRKKGWEGV